MELWIKGTAGTTGDCLYQDPMLRGTWCTPEVEKAVLSGMVGARNLGQRVQRVLD